MVRHLMTDGIELDDISLVTRDANATGDAATSSVGDASFFVGRADDPTANELVDERSPIADFEAVDESKLDNTGISTSDRTRTGETVDQMDDSQWLAEDTLEPRNNIGPAGHELDDLDLAVATGFPTPITPLDNEATANPNETELDRSLETIIVPGVGAVMGGGDLATAAFDFAKKNGEPDASAILTYLQDEGVPPEPANNLLEQFGNGGAILAVALVPEVDEQALETVAEGYGAVTVGWFGAPRY